MRCEEKFENHICYLLYYFVIYSFIGWCLETVYMSLRAGHLVNRGFLYGPFCPIYGFGALLLIILIKVLNGDKLKYFFYAVLSTTALELVIGIFLKAVFYRNWWDYSDEPFNFAGVICLKSSIMWGVLSMFFMSFIHPRISRLIINVPVHYKAIASYIIILYFVIDCASTLTSVTGFDLQLSQLLWITR